MISRTDPVIEITNQRESGSENRSLTQRRLMGGTSFKYVVKAWAQMKTLVL